MSVYSVIENDEYRPSPDRVEVYSKGLGVLTTRNTGLKLGKEGSIKTVCTTGRPIVKTTLKPPREPQVAI